MADMNEISVVAKALMKFIDEMNTHGLCYNNIVQISEICSEIKEHIDVINSWRKNEVIQIPKAIEPEEIVIEPEIEPKSEKKDDVKITRNRLGSAKVVEIAQIIADKYDDKKVDVVVTALAKKYKYDERTLRNLVEKITYVDLTNPHFTIVDGKIHKIIIPKESIFGNDVTSAKRISELLDKNDGDIMATITPDMSADDIIRIALVRWKFFVKGKYSSIGSPTKEILIMSIIREDKSRNANSVATIMNAKYDIPCDAAEVSAVKNGRSYKGLAKILGVIK